MPGFCTEITLAAGEVWLVHDGKTPRVDCRLALRLHVDKRHITPVQGLAENSYKLIERPSSYVTKLTGWWRQAVLNGGNAGTR